MTERKAKVLIAEDSTSIRAMLHTLLTQSGYDTILASDGLEAIQKTYEQQPDIILLDIFMPRMNGYQVCRLLRHDPATTGIPILILTSLEGKGDKFWSLHTGANEFLLKDEQLLSRIGETVGKYLHYPLHGFGSLEAPKRVLNEMEILVKLGSLLDAELYESTIEKSKLQIAVEGLMEGLICVDADMKITLFNPVMQRLTGFLESQALGKKCCEIFKESLCKNGCGFAPVFKKEEDVENRELDLVHGTRQTPVLFSMRLYRGDRNQIVGSICVFKDIAKLKEVETLKSDFVAMVTHELRSPLSIIESMAETLLEDEVKSPEEQKDLLGRIRDNAHRLLDLVNDLLDLSKMELGKVQLDLDEVDLPLLMKRCVQGSELLAAKKNIKIQWAVMPPFPERVTADSNRLEQVFINLLSNAVKYTPENGSISVELKPKENRVECVVADTGQGIAKDSLEKIFDKFHQIHDKESRQKGGTGLGLAVVKTIVEAHRGKIWCESEVGRGSRFIFEIPRVQF